MGSGFGLWRMRWTPTESVGRELRCIHQETRSESMAVNQSRHTSEGVNREHEEKGRIQGNKDN